MEAVLSNQLKVQLEMKEKIRYVDRQVRAVSSADDGDVWLVDNDGVFVGVEGQGSDTEDDTDATNADETSLSKNQKRRAFAKVTDAMYKHPNRTSVLKGLTKNQQAKRRKYRVLFNGCL